jgi:catechol 2,3-dioxygenase-like lactoylglutathione lyase family enzyme
MTAIATASAVQFQVSLNVTDLNRSIHFYRTLLAAEPHMNQAHQVRFELTEPPLRLTLLPAAQTPGGSLNHVGLRLPDSPALVEVQRRLEEAGIATQRQEGVECCYARQTKFWVTDPDRHLWELYVLEEDIEHSGFEDAPRPAAAPAPTSVIWEHRLLQPVPERIPHADASVDEVRLEGSYNVGRDSLRPAQFLAEISRVLRPGGQVIVHGLVGDRPVEAPSLPGLAALVQRVPAVSEILDDFVRAGFAGMYFEKLGAITCLQIEGSDLREMRLSARRPGPPTGAPRHRVIYKGPLQQVTDESGTIYPRGTMVLVTEQARQLLERCPAAGQFAFLPSI